MAGFDHDALAAAMPWEIDPFTILDSSSQAARTPIPHAWRPIADSTDPDERTHCARSLWNAELLSLVPKFADALNTRLVDVRVAKHTWIPTPCLDYVIAALDGDGYDVWMGEDPATFGDHDPPLFDTLPPAVQTFLRDIHAGFTTWDRESCGLTPPSVMSTFATHCNEPTDARPIQWHETRVPPPRMHRLLRVTGRGPHADLLTSPDLPPGTAITYINPDFELTTFSEALDLFMTMPL